MAPSYGQQAVRTADGVPLADWGRRVGASLLDTLVLVVVAIPVMIGLDVFPIIGSGSVSGPTNGIYEIFSLAIAFLYNGLLLKLAGATLGQLACGLRVVPVDQGRAVRSLSARAIVMRILFYSVVPSLVSFAASALRNTGSLPMLWIALLVSGAGSVYTLLNVLWALWDPKRQCLHDKVARTQVVHPAKYPQDRR